MQLRYARVTKQPISSIALWLAVSGGFLISELSGFSVGRYIVIAPLALTAYAAGRRLPPVYMAANLAVAFLVWLLFSFLLFGIVALEIGFLIEFVLCIGVLAVSGLLGRKQMRSRAG